jgi:hypothetical protein
MHSVAALRKRVVWISVIAGFILCVPSVVYGSSVLKAAALGIGVGLVAFHLLDRAVGVIALSGAADAKRGALKVFFVRYAMIGAGFLIVGRGGIAAISAYFLGVLFPTMVLGFYAIVGMRASRRTGEDVKG